MKVLWCCVVKGFRLRFKVNSGFYFDLNYLSVYLLYISKMFSFTKIALILSGLAASAFAQESIESQDFSIDSASDGAVEAMDAEVEAMGGRHRRYSHHDRRRSHHRFPMLIYYPYYNEQIPYYPSYPQAAAPLGQQQYGPMIGRGPASQYDSPMIGRGRAY